MPAARRIPSLEFAAPCWCRMDGKAGPPVLIRSEGRSEFQMRHLRAVSREPAFEHFCGNPGCDEHYRGPHMVTWFRKDGVMEAEYVGVDRVLHPRAHFQRPPK